MEQYIKDILKKDKKKEKGMLLGKMEALMREIFIIQLWMEKVYINGQMEGHTLESGPTVKSMEMEDLNGRTEIGMKDNIKMTKKMV